jgi:phosphoadenosine phosphosulfate reductase
MRGREQFLFRAQPSDPYRIGWTFDELLEEAIEVIRKYEPSEGYYGGFSGGKDSVMLKEVARMAGVKVRWRYNVTTIDPPELIYFIREHHPDVEFMRPEKGNFFTYAAKVACFPTRRARWCCEVYKEGKEPKGSTVLLGIRAEESPARRKRYAGFTNTHKGVTTIAPLLHIDTEDLWTFIKGRKLPYCSLYDEGFKRLGCIGCPFTGAKNRRRELDRWPKFEAKWKKLFQQVWERRNGTLQRNGKIWFGNAFFKNWEEMWEWWVSNKPLPKKKGGE